MGRKRALELDTIASETAYGEPGCGPNHHQPEEQTFVAREPHIECLSYPHTQRGVSLP
jgi:hypothetical protein